MINFILEYWLQIIFGFIISLIIYIYKKINSHYKTINTIKNGLKILLKSKIIEEYNRIVKNNSVTIFDKEIINDLYNEYKELGGNGVVKNMIEKLNNMNISGGD